MNVDDKADEDDFENDTNEEDIVDDEDYKEKDKDDKDDVDDDDDKVVKLASKNEKYSYQKDDFNMVLIYFDKNKYGEEPNPMVASTHQLRKFFKTRWL